eukprot:352989-Chlamydomonas_euryale.AAC.2
MERAGDVGGASTAPKVQQACGIWGGKSPSATNVGRRLQAQSEHAYGVWPLYARRAASGCPCAYPRVCRFVRPSVSVCVPIRWPVCPSLSPQPTALIPRLSEGERKRETECRDAPYVEIRETERGRA